MLVSTPTCPLPWKETTSLLPEAVYNSNIPEKIVRDKGSHARHAEAEGTHVELSRNRLKELESKRHVYLPLGKSGVREIQAHASGTSVLLPCQAGS